MSLPELPPCPPMVIPSMPARGGDIQAWVRMLTDGYMLGAVEAEKLREARRSAACVWEGERTKADVKRAEAAMVAAQAQERMGEVLAAFEHGGPAVAMLARLQEGVETKRRRALPGRVKALRDGSEPA